ncbi:MAG: 3-oxoacyl-[acyl-carrier-protein] reductase [Thermodesulfovibrionia bacterium]|nr:3-oxoacyl-[acyl-carrier-protein] reductase [Thermodesulfovibrionia bacterium]
MRLKGKNALITGSAQGIGMAIALAMAKEGANICIADIKVDNTGDLIAEINKSGVRCISTKLDVSSQESVTNAFETFINEFGSIDILVNNAGITRDSLALRMKEDDWDAVININLKGTFLCSKEAIKIMSKQRSGKIINISSVVAFIGNPGQINYSASKAGVIGITKTIAKEYAGRGIRVNAIAPGFIKTAMTEALPEKVKEDMKNAIPLREFGTPEDVANASIFLASNESDYLTGQVIHVNGGMYM